MIIIYIIYSKWSCIALCVQENADDGKNQVKLWQQAHSEEVSVCRSLVKRYLCVEVSSKRQGVERSI